MLHISNLDAILLVPGLLRKNKIPQEIVAIGRQFWNKHLGTSLWVKFGIHDGSVGILPISKVVPADSLLLILTPIV
jgi:hypothetical protein